ncbi:hypothetical protein OEA41_001395 [Lepraria neglecta]|uniref:EF-hand domain-containing protein n=1 Tax=Lepraria neglecta TaxID=209136 RepID=A0AAE0DLH0_9LECA|nr:hypothetical protein OEA41_001395 [Lepraria neglecta]
MCRRLNLIRYKSCGCELFEHEPQYCPEIIKAQGGPRPGPWIRTVVIGRKYETQMPNLSSEDNFQVCQDGYLHRVVTQHSYRDLLWPRCQGEVFSKGIIRNKCPWHDWLLMEEREWTKQEAARRRIKATREMAKKKQGEWEQSLLGKGEKILKKITQPNKPDEPNWKPRTQESFVSYTSPLSNPISCASTISNTVRADESVYRTHQTTARNFLKENKTENLSLLKTFKPRFITYGSECGTLQHVDTAEDETFIHSYKKLPDWSDQYRTCEDFNLNSTVPSDSAHGPQDPKLGRCPLCDDHPELVAAAAEEHRQSHPGDADRSGRIDMNEYFDEMARHAQSVGDADDLIQRRSPWTAAGKEQQMIEVAARHESWHDIVGSRINLALGWGLKNKEKIRTWDNTIPRIDEEEDLRETDIKKAREQYTALRELQRTVNRADTVDEAMDVLSNELHEQSLLKNGGTTGDKS